MTGEYRVVVRIETAAAAAAEATRPNARPVVPPDLDHAGRERVALITDHRKAGLDGYAADGTRSLRALQTDAPAHAEHRSGGIINGLSSELARNVPSTRLGSLIDDARSAASRVREFVPESVAAATKNALAPVLEKLAPIIKALPQIALVAQAIEGGIGLAASGALAKASAGLTGFLASPNFGADKAAASGSGLRAQALGLLNDVGLGAGILGDFAANLLGSATDAEEAAKVFGGELRANNLAGTGSDLGDAKRSFAALRGELSAWHKAHEEATAAFNHGRRLGGAPGFNRGNW